jgi:hypothetical protein
MDLHRSGVLRRTALYEVKAEKGNLKDCVVAADGKVCHFIQDGENAGPDVGGGSRGWHWGSGSRRGSGRRCWGRWRFMAGTNSTSGAETKHPDGERMDVAPVCPRENVT